MCLRKAISVVTMADAIETMEGIFCDIGRGEPKVFFVAMDMAPSRIHRSA